MKRGWMAVVALLLAGCAGSGTHAQAPSASAGLPAGPSSTPAASAPATPSTPLAFQCRLPYIFQEANGPTGPGFINVADGTFTPDPEGRLVSDATGNGLQTVRAPVLHGPGPQSYDWARSRWVPVPSSLVLADGAEYVYSVEIPNPNGQGLGGPPPLGTRIHLVDVGTGTDTVAYETTDLLFVIAVAPEGVYLGRVDRPSDTVQPFHLMLLDLGTHSMRPLLGGMTVGPPNGGYAVGAGWLWLVDVDSARPVLDARGQSQPNRLVRLSLSDGSRTAWLEKPSYVLQLVGLDLLGSPVLFAFQPDVSSSYVNWLVSAPSTVSAIAGSGFTAMVADKHGLWFTGWGVFFYSADGSLRQIYRRGGQLAGICG